MVDPQDNKDKRQLPETARTPEQPSDQTEELRVKKGPGVPIDVETGDRPIPGTQEILQDEEVPVDDGVPASTEEQEEPQLNIPDDTPPDSNRKEQEAAIIRDIQEEQESISRLSLGELFGKLVSNIRIFFDKIKEFDPSAIFGAAAATAYSPTELSEVAVKINENADTKYNTQDQSAAYVCSILGLPKRNTPMELLASLKKSGKVLDEKRESITTLKSGDLVFFKKNPGDTDPYLVAVISKTDPLSMKMIPEGGGNPVEIPLESSMQYKNQWLGSLKVKQS